MLDRLPLKYKRMNITVDFSVLYIHDKNITLPVVTVVTRNIARRDTMSFRAWCQRGQRSSAKMPAA